MLTSRKKTPDLAQILHHLVLSRLFLPLAALSVITIAGAGCLGKQTLENQQHQKAQFVACLVDRYLDQATRTLDAVGRAAEISLPENLAVFMQSTWEAYGYYDTLYYLDLSSKITVLKPPDPRYLGLDMSNLPDFQQTGEENSLITISRPFVSFRTGNPTVYVIIQLSRGDRVVGELSLGSLQDEITRTRGTQRDMIFMMDQAGMLLAHPSSNLVRQQTNRSDLEIFRRGLGRDATLIYDYAGTMVLCCAIRVQRTGWVVVNQISLSAALGPYAWIMGLAFLASLAIWLVLAWSLQNILEQRVATPLIQLGRGTDALAKGNFSQGKALASIPSAFAELTALATDFQQMSDALETRQAALQESEERYRSLFERVPAALFRATPAGRLLDVNPAFVDMLGYPKRETLLKVNAADLYLDPKDRERWCVAAERDGIARNFEYQLPRHDGTIIWVRNTSRAVRDRRGQTLYYEGNIQDITRWKAAEEEIRRFNRKLEQRVLDRTAELEAATMELADFSYTVSHDLRAPLRHIDGYLELFQQRSGGALDARSRHYIDTIASAGRRMGILIDSLLSFYQMRRRELSKVQVDLNDLVREVIRELAPEAAGRNIHWRIADLPEVTGDCAMLRIVFINLISNAMKFTRPRECPGIRISSFPGKGLETVIVVRDNGVGFDMKYTEKLFGVFQRLHRMEEFEGAGIGLANVRRIIARHGGRTWAESKLNQGAAFFVALPQTLQKSGDEKP